ncbi:GxxExxY protein, partial [Verrucomicrobia bacterium]|nr:GxxExxY protein [Verrucomicrobiota bacterium]
LYQGFGGDGERSQGNQAEEWGQSNGDSETQERNNHSSTLTPFHSSIITFMPITSEIQIRPTSRAVFAEVDAVVMKCAYAAQNHFGRLCEEAVYENDVKARLRAMDFKDVHTQVKLQLSHQGFEKSYRLDLVVNGVLYELKATDSLIPGHDAQTLNYAALLGLNRVKLINFGGRKVEGKLHCAPFAEIDRRHINVNRCEWQPQSRACDKLANWFERLVRSIGGFLRSKLYEEALVWF